MRKTGVRAFVSYWLKRYDKRRLPLIHDTAGKLLEAIPRSCLLVRDGKIGRNIDRETKCRPMIHILKTIVTPFQAIPTCFN